MDQEEEGQRVKAIKRSSEIRTEGAPPFGYQDKILTGNRPSGAEHYLAIISHYFLCVCTGV
jgi:hypothetical protein